MLAIVKDDQQHARCHKRRRENCRYPGQQVRRRSARHEPRHAPAAHAESAALALLQQHHPNKGYGDQDVHREKKNDHRQEYQAARCVGYGKT